jgi:type II secretion system protein N
MVLTTLSRYGLTHVNIGAVQPLFPPGLALRQVSFGQVAGGQSRELVRIAELRTYLRTFIPYRNLLQIHFEGDLSGGSLVGDVAWEQDGDGSGVQLRAQLQDVHLSALLLADRLSKGTVEGKFTGSMMLQMSSARGQEGESRLVFQAEAGGLPGLEVMGVKFPALAYEQLGGELVLQTQNVIIRDLLVRGRDWQVDARGKVGLREDLLQSMLDVTLRVRSSEAFEQQLGLVGTFLKQRRDRRGFASFRLSGTLGNPKFAL